MPKFEITSPDGKKFEITAPDGATPEQALSFAQEQFKQPPQASKGDIIAGMPLTRAAMGLASPLIAAAQGGAHIGDAINTMTGHEPMVSPWIDKQLANYEAAKQRGMKAAGNEGFDFMGLMGSLAPTTVAANAVTKALPAAKSIGTRMLSGGAAGATAGAVQPVMQGDFAEEKAKQIGTGGAVGMVAPLISQALMGIKGMVEPFYQSGRDAIIGRTLQTASGGKEAEVMNALKNARQIVPGSQPTVGQASQNAGIASLERAAGAISPEATVATAGRAADQNAARVAALQSVAKDSNAMAAAEQARKAATSGLIQKVNESTAEVNPARTVSLLNNIIKRSPGRTQLTSTLENVKKSLFESHPLEQRGKEAWKAVNDGFTAKPWGVNDTEVLSATRTVLDRVKTGKIGQEEALEQLRGLKGVNPKAEELITLAKDAIKAPDERLRSNASQLYQGARKNITDLLAAKAGDGSKINEAISRELTVVMKSLDNQINKVEPAYGQFMQTFAEKSKPINQMEIGQEVLGKAVNAKGDVQLNALASALSDRTAQRATGFKRATMQGVMDPQQMQTLNAVKEDLLRAVQARDMAGTAGSDTVKKLAYSNMIDRAGVPTFLREFAPTQVVGNFMARGADSVYGRANKELAQQLADTLLDPQRAAQAMQGAVPSRYSKLIDALVQQASVGAGTVAGREVR